MITRDELIDFLDFYEKNTWDIPIDEIDKKAIIDTYIKKSIKSSTEDENVCDHNWEYQGHRSDGRWKCSKCWEFKLQTE